MPRPRVYQTPAEKKAAYRLRQGIEARPYYTSPAARQRAYRQRKRVRGYFRHSQTDWQTPQNLFDALDAEFHFTLDVAASPSNTKCAQFYTAQQDGLCQPWQGVCWCNPPYGPQIAQWMEKAVRASQEGATVVCLVPARTDTRWWHAWVQPYAEIRFLAGRLRFSGATVNAPFPSAVVIFRPQ